MNVVAPPLWSGRARRLLVGCCSGGLALMISGWVQLSGGSSVDAQIPWLNVAVSGLLLAGFGNTLWLLRGRRSVADLRTSLLPPTFGTTGEPVDAPVPAEQRQLVSAAGMTRYHRPDCLLAAGKPVVGASRRTHEMAGRLPCRTCRP